MIVPARTPRSGPARRGATPPGLRPPGCRARRWVALVAALGAAMSLGLPTAEGGQAGDRAALDEAVAAFWAADSDAGYRDAIDAVLAADSDIDAIWSRLRRGRTYRADVPTGRQVLDRRNRDGVEHRYILHVPADYDPAVRYPAHVHLHGGVMRPRQDDGGWWRNEDRVIRDDAIVVIPESWAESLWWQDSQIENLAGILRDVRRTYNVDENRIHLLGVSDGGTGAYYHAFKATTPWASFLPFIAHPVVLANPSSGADGDMHPTNLRNKPLFVVNGGRDRLYPTASVVPYLRLFREAGVFLDFRPQPEAGHDLSWWESEAEAIDAFMDNARRQPAPPRVSWETERTDRYNRAHWLVIDELGSAQGEPGLGSFNTIADPASGQPLGISMIGELVDGSGIRVFEIEDGSIASDSGMRDNDTIVEIEGREAPTVEDLKNALIGFAPGDSLSLVVERDGVQEAVALVYPPTAAPRTRTAFPRQRPSGRVELSQQGNRVEAYTRGVLRFTLLLSPEQFDFTQPITVEANGTTVFEGPVEPDVPTLLRWAAIDQDRTMLFGAALEIELPAADAP